VDSSAQHAITSHVASKFLRPEFDPSLRVRRLVSRAKSARGGRGISFACATPTLRATVWLMEVWSVLVSYPDDVKESVSTVKRAIHFVNELLATFRVPLILNCRNWKDTTPGAHPVSVQQKIEEDLRFDDCDIVIGLFWKRLGTKRPGTKSGCERELQIAVDACKLNRRPNVLTYFNQEMTPPATGSIEDAENQLGLAKLKDHLQSLNVQTADYNGDRELERLLVKHLMSLAGGASIADTRLQSAIKGKVFYRQWDFRVEAAAELINGVPQISSYADSLIRKDQDALTVVSLGVDAFRRAEADGFAILGNFPSCGGGLWNSAL
jgi:hypothetical protein